jgi:hypothetical protein
LHHTLIGPAYNNVAVAQQNIVLYSVWLIHSPFAWYISYMHIMYIYILYVYDYIYISYIYMYMSLYGKFITYTSFIYIISYYSIQNLAITQRIWGSSSWGPKKCDAKVALPAASLSAMPELWLCWSCGSSMSSPSTKNQQKWMNQMG